MSRARPRAWVRLDNASNIFLAARNDRDPKVFRISAEMDAPVDPGLLEQALQSTYDRYPLYHAVLRRGVFWYYLQDSDLRPSVEAEKLPPCAAIYSPDRPRLLFRVVHHGHRISLETFHALSDGTGALWFLTDLLTRYASLQHPQAVTDTPDSSPPPQELAPDSFAQYFRRRPSTAQQAFQQAASPAVMTLPEDQLSRASAATAPDDPAPSRVHRVRGTRTPDGRTRCVELSMPAAEVLALSKAAQVSLTTYLTALFFQAVRASSDRTAERLSASVPVNLRQFFPSTSARNFFATVRVDHVGAVDDEPAAIARDLEQQLRHQTDPERLAQKLRRLIRLERSPLLRVIPRPLKDVILGSANVLSNRGLSVAISNLGRVELPEPARSHVVRLMFQVSAVRPQFCAISHDGILTITFTSPFEDMGHVREFARALSAQGVSVTVAAS